ncbi:HD domain-containing protein [Melittangium boletus]|uniref:HD domain-containing protein n=1 Tax=Melittangium boletus TaxID=83453 RepID=UPI003DA42B2E
MHTKAAPSRALLQGRGVSPLIEAYLELHHLKHLFRQGWLRVGIPRETCESVAEHSYFVAMLCLFLADGHFPEADATKLVRMALLHDVGEARAGDITPHDGVSREEKLRREREAVEHLFAPLPRGADYLALWEEYERGTSLEARLVRQVDRLEMGLQATVYEHQGAGDLSQFFASVRRALEAPEFQALLAELETLRPRD